MPNTPRGQLPRIIVPYERTLVTSLYPDSDLPTTVGSTIISSGAPVILANPGRHPALTTFLTNPVGGATETRAWRVIMGADQLDAVWNNPDLVQFQMTGAAIARSKNLFLVDGDTFTAECAKEAGQASAEVVLRQGRRWANQYCFTEAAARFSGYYFQKTGTYLRQGLTDIWLAEQHLRLTQGKPPWHCPMCDHRLPYPLPSRMCPRCKMAFTPDWPTTRWTRPSVQQRERSLHLPRWMELSVMQNKYADKDPRYAHFLGSVLRAERDGQRGETQRQTVMRLGGFDYKTVAAYYTRLGLELRR